MLITPLLAIECMEYGKIEAEPKIRGKIDFQ
jgi:hypothetical protein